MATLSFSETYNLFRLNEIRAIIEECLAKHGMPKIQPLTSEEGVVLEASGDKLSMRITLRQETIGSEGRGYFKGQPRVKIEFAASSHDENSLAESIDRFRYCILIRASRGGG